MSDIRKDIEEIISHYADGTWDGLEQANFMEYEQGAPQKCADQIVEYIANFLAPKPEGEPMSDEPGHVAFYNRANTTPTDLATLKQENERLHEELLLRDAVWLPGKDAEIERLNMKPTYSLNQITPCGGSCLNIMSFASIFWSVTMLTTWKSG